MTREPHIHTPAHDPGRPRMGDANWWRRHMPKQPDWWPRVFAEPFENPIEEKPKMSNEPEDGLTELRKELRKQNENLRANVEKLVDEKADLTAANVRLTEAVADLEKQLQLKSGLGIHENQPTIFRQLLIKARRAMTSDPGWDDAEHVTDAVESIDKALGSVPDEARGAYDH